VTIRAARLFAVLVRPWRAGQSTVDVALVVAFDHDDLEAGHHGGGRVGAVGRRGIRQTSRPPSPLASCQRADGHEAGILALAAGVGLQGHRIEAGDLAQPASSSSNSCW
jgi:hypothetical protein